MLFLSLLVHTLAANALQTTVDLSLFVNNKAAAVEGSLASYDGHNGSYPAEYLPTGTLVDAAINVRYFTSRDIVYSCLLSIPSPTSQICP